MSQQDWLRLALAPGLGATVAAKLLDRFQTPAAALASGERSWRELGMPAAARSALLQAPEDNPQLAIATRWLETSGHHLLTIDSPHYPQPLAALDRPPPWLYGLGDIDLLQYPAIAIVGSRNPTHAGLAAAREFGAALAGAGLVVVSGLARGIDAAAHEGALSANGMTIAVCGTGLDRVYPAAHRDLAERIGSQGLLLSEFALGSHPARGNFPRRNRIIAGLCTATLVVEAARASGSLITARMAMQAGREVFALPGSIHNPLARGCHQLIRDGAKLVETTEHILEEIADSIGGYRAAAVPQASQKAAKNAGAEPVATATSPHDDGALLLDALGHAPARIDDLVKRTGWPAEAVSSTLLILELEGRVTILPGGAYSRT